MPPFPYHSTVALVVAPTRELAMQILEEFKAVGGSTGIKSVATYGGISRTTQLPAMARGAFDVLIATPGRLIDYICSEDVQVRTFASWQSFLIDSCADCSRAFTVEASHLSRHR